MISKELLEEVYLDTQNEYTIALDDNELMVSWKNSYVCINIHELAFKCKLYVATKDIAMSNGNSILDSKILEYYCSLYMDTTGCCNKHFTAKTEPEAIIKATQWVYDNA